MSAEKDTLLSEQNAAVESSAGEMEKLLSTVASLTSERDQLTVDQQEHVQMVRDLNVTNVFKSILSLRPGMQFESNQSP